MIWVHEIFIIYDNLLRQKKKIFGA